MRARTVDPVMVHRRAAEFTTRSIKASTKAHGIRLAISLVDLTTLEGSDTPEKVRSLCDRGLRPLPRELDPPIPPVAAVCVYPSMVRTAKERLRDTPIKVASVATAFPSGQAPLETRLAEVAAAVDAGADEIDMVINRGAFLSGRTVPASSSSPFIETPSAPASEAATAPTSPLRTTSRSSAFMPVTDNTPSTA